MFNICKTGIPEGMEKVKGNVIEEIIKIPRNDGHKFLDTRNSANLHTYTKTHYPKVSQYWRQEGPF